MAQQSAGILLYRFRDGVPQVLLVHPGGPFWSAKNAGVWSIPKGLLNVDESVEDAARREFEEELGFPPPNGCFSALPPVRAKSGQTVYAFAVAGDLDASAIVSNTFRVEYPYKSGKWQDFPEVDRAEWFILADARISISAYQAPLLDALEMLLQH